jgi:hypothetical protein
VGQFKEFLLRADPVVLVIGGSIAARWTRHRSFDLSRALVMNSVLSCCFAGPFFRFGGDKAVVAFLFIFIFTAPITVARWSEYHRCQETLQSKKAYEKLPC